MLAGALKFPLFLLSLVYGLAVRILAFLYGLRPFTPRVRVISVGNITLGGTGKTMLVEYLAGFFEGEGRKTAVLSRGYKRPGKGKGFYPELGDEAGMLQKKFPSLKVLVDPDRVRTLRLAASQGMDTAILDDGFQQWRIRKDLDIVCVDAGGFGNGQLIPRGILREPLSALRRADVFILTNTCLALPDRVGRLRDSLMRLNPSALVVESNHEPRGFYRVGAGPREPERLEKAGLVCGIGNPESFFDCCRRAGIGPGPKFIFPDHHAFVGADVRRIVSCCKREGVDAVVTTEKDQMRLSAVHMEEHGLGLYVLKAAMRITSNEQEFADRLRGLFPA